MNSTASDLKEQHMAKVLRGCLQNCEAISFDSLVSGTGIDAVMVESILEQMKGSGEVEVIAPMFRENDKKYTFFRLIRPTDNSFGWEQDVQVWMPVGKMSDTRKYVGEGIDETVLTDIRLNEGYTAASCA